MCLVCIELAKGTITNREARRALWETILTAEDKEEVTHIQDLYGKLEKEEIENEKVSKVDNT